MNRLLSLFLAVGIVFEVPAPAIMMRPETVPIERLIAAASVVLKQDPANAPAEYTLARIHYLAFVCATKQLDAYLEPLPKVGPFQNFTTARVQGKDLPDEEAAAHISKALQHFQAAQKLAPKNALYRLGYASLLEQASDWARRHPRAEAPASIRALKPADLREAYRVVWQMELEADFKERQERGMFSPMNMVSYESGTAFVRLCRKDAETLSGQERNMLTKVHASLEVLTKDLPRAITPIVFATKPVRKFGELLAPETIVDFPLRGWGPVGRWPWVQPGTALLVWNPSRSGVIQSGAQLFGGYTWELFWKTGYEPLAVLDANGDGTLKEDELDGIAAWFDRNGNGRSDSGEVQPLGELGIVAIAVNASTKEGLHPMNPHGITFRDGRTLPSWDWIVSPIPSPSLARAPIHQPSIISNQK
jgi:hypothetical protein